MRLVVALGDPAIAARVAAELADLGDLETVDAVADALDGLARAPVHAVLLGDGVDGGSWVDAYGDLTVEAPGRPFVLLLEDPDDETAHEVLAGSPSTVLGISALGTGVLAGRVRELVARADVVTVDEQRFTHLQALLGSLDEGVVVYAPSGRIVGANARARLLLGEGPGTLAVPMAGLETYAPDGRRLAAEELPFAVALRTGTETPTVDVLTRLGDGTFRWFAATGRPLRRDGARAPYAIVCTFRDVTDERAADAARRRAERRQHLLVEHAVEGYLVLAPDGRVLETSASVGRFWPLKTVLGRDGVALVAAEDRAAARALFRAAIWRPGVPMRAELRVRDVRDALRWVELTLVNQMNEPAIGGLVVNVRDITERKRAEESMARLSAIVESSDDAIVSETLEGTITSWNKAAERLFGYRAGEALGRSSALVVPEDQQARVAQVRERIAAGDRVRPWEADRKRKDGSVVAVALTFSPIFDAAGTLAGTSWSARDVSERRWLDAARRVAEERFRLGFEHGAIGMAMIDAAHRLTRVNPALARLLGRSQAELIGRRLEEFSPGFPPIHRASLDGLEEARAHYQGDQRFVRADGAILWAHVDLAVVRVEPDVAPYLFAQIQDITDRKRGEAALAHQALHDELTGLPNRALLADRLGQALRRTGRDGGGTAVLFLDIDRFKLVNDGLGHAVGDRLLVDIAARLSAGVRASDTVARFGGDEFIVVCEGVEDTRGAQALGAQVTALFTEPFVVDGKELYVTASCGVVLSAPGTTAEGALRDADAAMYRAKERGRARTEVFDEALRAEVAARFELERELRLALERNELRVAYQPILDMTTDRLAGVEALVRWIHPERGLVLPMEFITAAEDSGLVVRIGEFVLESALAELARWRRDLPGCAGLAVSVNLSSRELARADPVALCKRALAAAGLEASALRLELTESAVMEDVEASIAQLAALRALGVTVVVDDFGTGHSSLSYLSRLPVGALKIDRSFVAGLDGHGSGSAIVRAIVGLAETMRLELCAEGIERPEQARALVRLGCRLGQGHLFAPPLYARRFAEWVRGRQRPARDDDPVRRDDPARLDAIAHVGET